MYALTGRALRSGFDHPRAEANQPDISQQKTNKPRSGVDSKTLLNPVMGEFRPSRKTKGRRTPAGAVFLLNTKLLIPRISLARFMDRKGSDSIREKGDKDPRRHHQ
jgi:hypothetical protein